MDIEPEFVSHQTYDTRRFYLDLQPSPQKPLSVVCGGVERMEASYLVERSDFPYFAIEWVTEGVGSLSMGDGEFELSTGSLFAYGPGIAHRIRNVGPVNMRKYYLDIAGVEAADTLRQLGLLDSEPITISRPFELVEIFQLIDREARDAFDHSAELCALLTRVLLQKIRQRKLSNRGKNVSEAFHTFEAVRQLIEDRFLDFVTIEQVADAFGVSAVYLSRLFNRFAGLGAYRYLLRLRMSYAAELLLDNGLKVKAVAERLQYADAFQFSRAFKRIYGVPPNAFVRAAPRK